MTSTLNDAGLLGLDLRARRSRAPEEMVLVALPDMQGRLQGKRMPAGYFAEHVAETGAEFCAYLLATDIDMQPLDGYAHASWATGYGDMHVVPDLATMRRLAWPGGGVLVLADACDATGANLSIAPRTMLRRQLGLLQQELGLTAKVGVETEFTVYRGTGSAALDQLQPVSERNLDYHLTHPRPMRDFLHSLEEALTGSGLPLESTKTEAAPGQVEVTFRYGDPIEAADNHCILKHAAHQLGEATDVTPVFMAAPQTGIGNGLHVHLSLWEDHKPVLASDDGGLLPAGHQAIAGLVEVLPHLMPLLLSTPNSYKRLRPNTFAPTHMSWGWDNRTCAIRVAGHGRNRHLEIRVPGADANPYLALTAVIAAIRDGTGRHLTPPAPVGDNTTAPVLPATLDAALHLFASSKPAADLLGPDVVSHYSTAAHHEIEAMNTEVTDIERCRGFARA
ncbi:glutamine synthetase family protein [Actinacidiphila paucisporea]|uniref:Glutamine synthetase n=1 Tax=Actinacidiphila paucisporea TaxID=310782 RepID=A0A1M6YJX2_9ACTN|nr:glutamine synthetase family protein [Actinacidiphila paucisporea]SHL18556.1 glutamine synthetase [Actinacidiphila paucisporea]